MCILVVDTFAGLRPHLAQVFTSMAYDDLSLPYGYATILATWLNFPLVVILESMIVEKANKCLDFTCTFLFFHLFLMTLYDGWPDWSFTFWFNTIIWAIVTVLACESICMKLETQEIKLNINDLLEHTA